MEEIKSNRDEGVRLALEDVAIIKRIVDRSQANLSRLGWLFLVYGGATLGAQLLTNLAMIAAARLFSLETASFAGATSEIFTIAIKGLLLFLFLRKRRMLAREENVYTMRLFDLWGITLFAPYALSLIVMCFGSLIGGGLTAVILSRAAMGAVKYGAVCMSIFVTGLFSGSRLMKWGSGVLAMALPALLLTGVPAVLSHPAEFSGALEAYGYFSSVNALVNLALTVVYVVMGIVFLKRKRGAADGAE